MFLLTHREEETTVSAGENTKHTPGPWVATPSDPAEGVECIWITACPAPNQEKEIAAVYGPQNEKNKATAALIAAAQAVEHYEITRYGTLIEWARQLGRSDCAAVLEKNLKEEKATDKKLTSLAESKVNLQAAE